MSKIIYYFAFGSNMHANRLNQRIGQFKTLGIGFLAHYQLVFHKVGDDDSGKCTVIKKDDQSVWGVVYEISPEQKIKLDDCEGLGQGYLEITKDVLINHQPLQVVLYQAQNNATDDRLSPFGWYKNFVLVGATFNNLPEKYISYIKQVPIIEESNQQRELEYMNILNNVSS